MEKTLWIKSLRDQVLDLGESQPDRTTPRSDYRFASHVHPSIASRVAEKGIRRELSQLERVMRKRKEAISLTLVDSMCGTPDGSPSSRSYTAQARYVHRALEYALTGDIVIPPPNDKSGHFSEENWGDYEKVKKVEGRDYTVKVKRATRFATTIKAKDTAWWKEFYAAAKQYVGRKDSDSKVRRASEPPSGPHIEEESDDEVIVDVKYDAPAARMSVDDAPQSSS
ncbi:hypothetical protein NMY22_g8328 [Coprinellus aureogranulatus]|nr:hypothetical protein NMY22_g8328 [Coprinellus aureogranulatus]